MEGGGAYGLEGVAALDAAGVAGGGALAGLGGRAGLGGCAGRGGCGVRGRGRGAHEAEEEGEEECGDAGEHCVNGCGCK